MKRKKMIRFACLMAVAVSLAACTQDELRSPAEGVEGTAVTFTATGIAQTQVESRSTIDGTWEDVKSVGVKIGYYTREYAATVDANNPSRVSLAAAEGVDPFYWLNHTDTKSVQAWYPYEAGENAMPKVLVQQDQSIEANFLASDYIGANQNVTYDNTVLKFTHRTAKLTVILSGDSEMLDGSKVILFNLNTDNGNPDNINCLDMSNGNTYMHQALIAPQTFAAGNELLKVIMTNGKAVAYIPEQTLTFEGGSQYVITIKVNATSLNATVGSSIPWGDEVISENKIEVIETDDYICYDFNGHRYYYVKTEAGLKAWAEYVNARHYDTNCTLMNDINFTPNQDGSSNWEPITKAYEGTFDGAGHQLDYITMKSTENTTKFGFINELTGTIKNLTIGKNCTFETTDCDATGSVVGGLYEGGRIINCHSQASVTGQRYIGGIAGRLEYNPNEKGCLLLGCSFSGSLSYAPRSNSSYKYVGGIVGLTYNEQRVPDWGEDILYMQHIVGCYHTGTINIKANPYDGIGGIAGNLLTSFYGRLLYVGCYSTDALSSVATENSRVGGLVGEVKTTGPYSRLSACYWSNYSGEGVGYVSGSLAELNIGFVDGTTTNWDTATENMNAAIREWNAANDNLCPYHYVQTNGTSNPPTLVEGAP